MPLLPDTPEIVGAVVYTDPEDRDVSPIPTLFHIAGSSSTPPRRTDAVSEYYYPDVKSRKFATPFHDDFHYRTEAVSHTRNLTFLKPRIGGPYFDLETIWDEHTYYEFADRSVEHTMSTMVQEPYVNHVPTVWLNLPRRTSGVWADGRGKDDRRHRAREPFEILCGPLHF